MNTTRVQDMSLKTGDSQTSQPMQSRQICFHLSMLLIVCGIVFGFKASDRGFWGKHGEARRAEVSREMVASGDWVIPHLNGEPFVTKPPLYYWTAALAFTLTGQANELNARLPSIISGTLGVLIIYFWASFLFSQRVGLLAGIILATSFLYGGMARTAGVDMMLTLFTTAALCCFSVGQKCKSHFANSPSHAKVCTSLYLLTAVWIGLGTLTKNPIGLAVPLLAIGAFILVTRNFKLILEMKPWWGLLLFLSIVVPWFILMYQRVPDFLEVLYEETFGRYTDPEATPHLEPFYYYVPALGAFAPWVTFLPGTIISLFSQKARYISRAYLFIIIASLTTFLLFSSVGSKREYYLLPLYPMLAILVAKFWDEYFSLKQNKRKRWTWKSMDIPVVGFAGVLCLVGLGLPIAARLYLPKYTVSSSIFGILFFCAGILLLVMFFRGKVGWIFGVYSTATILLYLFTLTVIVPEIDLYRSRKPFFREAASIVGNHTLVSHNYLGLDAQFYLQRIIPIRYMPHDLNNFLESNEFTFVLMNGGQYAYLQQEHPELLERLSVVLDRVWTSVLNPRQQKRMLLLKTIKK